MESHTKHPAIKVIVNEMSNVVCYESLRLSQYGWPCGPPDGRLSMMVVCYESLRLSQHGWPCGPPDGRLSMMVVYYKKHLYKGFSVKVPGRTGRDEECRKNMKGR